MSDRPVAIVTGASRGIGAATVKAFAQGGYDCVLVAHDEHQLNQVASDCEANGAATLVCAGDLCDLEFARTTVDRARDRWGCIDVLVNNAAWRDIVTMRQIELSSWEKTLRICLTVPAFLSRWCAESMEPAGRGVILNISSIQSKFVAGISPAYTAAKGGLDALTYELATLYGPSGIRVLGANLGAIDTELSRGYGTSDLDQKIRDHVEGMIPLQRFGQPEEIARTLVMLASDAATYLTGTCIEIDGGWFHQCSPYAIKNLQFPTEFKAPAGGTQ
ncbi:SDR family NAD(P)-dependent oxidoreductase [Planctomicrobium sp. SH661]|uniref:SDR family NAD(P)-dependent oxidoreductase n=1 Tax=Planctomicrobium sp. SH661 TaxID=3448124 RepID=UPI003F5C7AF3